MNKLYSKPNLGFLKKTSNSILRPSQVWSHKALYSRPSYLYRHQKKKAEPQEDEQFIISDEELIDSQHIRKQTFRERNKVTFGLFGTGVVSSFLGFPLVATGLYTASFISLWRAERLWLRIWKLYEDIYGINTQKYMNLNSLLIDLMQKNDEVGKFIKRDTITFSNMFLSRKSHAENRLFNHDSYESVQRRYNYTLDFFDVGTGAEGRISVKSQCVYNYDKDYYFRLIYVYMFSPKQMIVKIEDNRDTVDIPVEPK